MTKDKEKKIKEIEKTCKNCFHNDDNIRDTCGVCHNYSKWFIHPLFDTKNLPDKEKKL